jgi:hypothetical protein
LPYDHKPSTARNFSEGGTGEIHVSVVNLATTESSAATVNGAIGIDTHTLASKSPTSQHHSGKVRVAGSNPVVRSP